MTVEIKIDPTPITLENFYTGHHFTNEENVYDDDKETILVDELAFPTIDKINTIEDKLQIKFPKKLTQLYLKQNGGPVGSLMIAKSKNSQLIEEDWIAPFSGYDDLNTLEMLRSVFDSVQDYAEYPDDIERFPQNSERLIILAQWYREILFLDYRHSDEPRIGFTDLDEFENLQNNSWEAETVWWDSFDIFFSQLQRGKYI